MDVKFLESEVNKGKQEWSFSLVGYAIGKRPFYGSLLVAVKRKWNCKGALEFLILEGDFFLFKFSYKKDFDMVNDHEPCLTGGHCYSKNGVGIFPLPKSS